MAIATKGNNNIEVIFNTLKGEAHAILDILSSNPGKFFTPNELAIACNSPSDLVSIVASRLNLDKNLKDALEVMETDLRINNSIISKRTDHYQNMLRIEYTMPDIVAIEVQKLLHKDKNHKLNKTQKTALCSTLLESAYLQKITSYIKRQLDSRREYTGNSRIPLGIRQMKKITGATSNKDVVVIVNDIQKTFFDRLSKCMQNIPVFECFTKNPNTSISNTYKMPLKVQDVLIGAIDNIDTKPFLRKDIELLTETEKMTIMFIASNDDGLAKVEHISSFFNWDREKTLKVRSDINKKDFQKLEIVCRKTRRNKITHLQVKYPELVREEINRNRTR